MIKEYLLNNPLIVFVVSKKNKFIYMKIARTGGVSIHRFVMKKEVDTINSKENPEEINEWLQNLDERKLKDYFIFTFVRNPWDRLVSVYFYFKDIRSPEIIDGKINIQEYSFEEFIKKKIFKKTDLLKKHSLPQHLYVEYNGIKFINFIGRFENLEEDWKFVANKIGIKSKLPHKNKSYHEHYTKYYNEETKNIVAEEYKRDIELFGYKFGG